VHGASVALLGHNPGDMAAVDPKAAAAAAPKGADAAAKERVLTIVELLDWLVEDKMIDQGEAAKAKKERRYYRGTQHPLTVIADLNWKSALPPYKELTLEPLTEWFAKRVGLEYRH